MKLLVLILVLMFSVSVVAGVAEPQDYKFGPELSDFKIKKGQKTVIIPVKVTNITKKRIFLETVVSEFLPLSLPSKDEEGKKTVYPYDVSSKIRISEKTFELASKETTIIRFYYDVEEGREGSVFFRYAFENDKKRDKKIARKALPNKDGEMESQFKIKIKKVGRASIVYPKNKLNLQVVKYGEEFAETSFILRTAFENVGKSYHSRVSANAIVFEDNVFKEKSKCLVRGKDVANLYPSGKLGVECVFNFKKKGKLKVIYFLRKGKQSLSQSEITYD